MRSILFYIRTALVILLSGALLACGGNNNGSNSPQVYFEPMGLDGHKVFQFTAYNNSEILYAATDKGLFVLIDDNWQLISQANWIVNSIEVLYSSHLLASVSIDGEHFLMESLNAGANWSAVENDFGGEYGLNILQAPRKIVFDDSTGILYAVGVGVLAQSDDFGRSWLEISGSWQTFGNGFSALLQHTLTEDLWVGGQGAIENPVLKQIASDGNMTVDHSSAAAELLEVPSTIKSVRYAPQNDKIIVSGEGGIIQSLDDGNNWEALNTNHTSRFYFDVMIEPQNNDILYTAGWDKNFDEPQPLILELSINGGESWLEYPYGSNTIRGGVWSMSLREHNNEKILYLGLCNGGIVQAKIQL